MAPKAAKQPAAAAAAAAEPATQPPQQSAPEEEIEEIQVTKPEKLEKVTFLLDHEDPPELESDAGEDSDEDDAASDEEGFADMEDVVTAVGQLTQLMMTEEGEAITDVLNGIRDALDKQNKIFYRGLQLLESAFGKRT